MQFTNPGNQLRQLLPRCGYSFKVLIIDLVEGVQVGVVPAPTPRPVPGIGNSLQGDR